MDRQECGRRRKEHLHVYPLNPAAPALAISEKPWLKCRGQPRYMKGNMASPAAERNQPVLLQSAEPPGAESESRVRRDAPRPGFGFWAMSFAIALSAFWIGTTGAYLWGYLGPAGIAALRL